MSNHKTADAKETELLQTRVHKKAKVLIAGIARGQAISEAAVVRQFVYRCLGLIKED